jgi:hypothetical protein
MPMVAFRVSLGSCTFVGFQVKQPARAAARQLSIWGLIEKLGRNLKEK